MAAGRGGTSGRTATGGRASSGDAGEAGEGVTNVGGTLSGAGGTIPNAGFAGSAAGASALGGTGGALGGAGAGGSGAPSPPFGWRCSFASYNDGQCDCGCGVADVDCGDGNDIDDCEKCDSPGSCNGGECPGKLREDNPSLCSPPPIEWVCPDYSYMDFGVCDCGCGIVDPDCADASFESCDVCNLPGSCANNSCANSAIDKADNSTCDIPEGWTCTSVHYLDGVCDCGCGVVDADCSSAAVSACEQCYYGCADSACPGPIDAANNAICTGVPVRWTCAARFYNDGSLCHCGCGVADPDCENGTRDVCDRCDFEGSCSARACPGTIDPNDNAVCEHPSPPPEWICSSYRYADGTYCDCGCGVIDLDCATNDITLCESCYYCGWNCQSQVDPANIAECRQPPPEWECDRQWYADGYDCTCGCGAPDPDCQSPLASACASCPQYQGSCSAYGCAEINPDDNSRCNPTAPTGWVCDDDWYGDRACDCGCGAVDVDCASPNRSDCDFCPAGSCSPSNCSTISDSNNAVCVAVD